MVPITASTQPASGAASPAHASRAGRLARPETAFALALAVLSLRTLWLAAGDKHYLLLDDAFTSFRYARNLVRGLGLVFNPGERVEGYTNFLWTVLLAGCEALGLDLPTASVGLAFLATAGTLLVLLLFGLRTFARTDGAPAWLAALPPLLVAAGAAPARYVVSGMETSLFVFLVLLALYLLVRPAPPLATGLAFAVAAMTRPEGVLYLGIALLFQVLWGEGDGPRRWKTAASILGGFLLLFLPWFLWRWQYYGYLLPNTFYAKAGTGPSGPLLARGWSLLLQMGRQAGVELPLLLAFAGLPAAVRRERVWRLLWKALAATAVYVVLVGGDFLFFFGPRFLSPAVPLLLLLAARGLAALLRPAAARPALRAAIAAAAVALLLVNGAWLTWPSAADLAYLPVINESWTEIGRWIASNTPEDAVVAIGAVGRIPYYSDRVTIDMLGLTDIHIAHLEVPLGAGIPGHEKYDTAYVLSRRPDYLVFPRLDPQGRPFLVDWPRFQEAIEADYEMIAVARMADSPAPWIVETPEWTPALGRQGYLASLYRRRQD
jgi:arabinofuranosyltransferase